MYERLVSATPTRFCEGVEVSVGGTVRQNIFVIECADHQLLLGAPFLIANRAQSNWSKDGNMMMACGSSDGTRSAVSRVMNQERMHWAFPA